MKPINLKKRRRSKKTFNPTQDEINSAKTAYFESGGKIKRIDTKSKTLEDILSKNKGTRDVDEFLIN